ncbi:MAG: TonB-dependent receptor, partial [Rhodospirillaceae bacterium]|nr:TonB-dependent receptor [Rhodospirillaceae bacterium]
PVYYVTLSEGFRPGLLNRPGGTANPAGTFTVPHSLHTDEVTNFEVGIKSDFGNAFRLNAALFNIDIANLQTTIFDPSIVNLFFSDNAADAKVTGLEADFTWLPEWSDGLTVAGAVSVLNSEITRVITPTEDVRLGDELAFAPSSQGNLRARYEWDLQATGLTAHVMPMISWSAESYSDIITINRDLIDGWTMIGLTAGVTSDDWSVELYASNLTDERAEVSRSFGFDIQYVTYAQPRTFGVRASVNF